MVSEPTGHEPWTAVDLRATSVTERAAFRRCRRQWLLSAVHRLRGVGANTNFRFGEAIHAGLERWYQDAQGDLVAMGPKIRRERSLEAYWSSWEEWAADVRDELGGLWDDARSEVEEWGMTGEGMLTTYYDRDEAAPLGEVVEVEVRHRVPILDPRTGKPTRPRAWLNFRLDLVTRKANGQTRVVDHKTAGSKHRSSQLDLDDQLTGYTYCWWRLTGDWPEDAVYNELIKKVAKPPRLIKKGTALSQDKSQSTTYDLYRQAIRDHGLPYADYAEILKALKSRGWEEFFSQEGVFRTTGQIAEFERNLYEEWRDMRAVARAPERAYPSPSMFNCPGCGVRAICQAMMDQGDAGAIIRDQYVVGEERYPL